MKHFLWLLLIPTMAQAMTRYHVADGWNLRDGYGMASTIYGQASSEAVAIVIGQHGDWREICIGDANRSCMTGRSVWVKKDALLPLKTKVKHQEPANDDSESTTCLDGKCPRKKAHHASREQLDRVAEEIDPNNPRGFKLTREYAPKCAGFITPGGLGKYGRAVVDAAAHIAPDCFYNHNLFGSMCPKYNKINPRTHKPYLTGRQKNALIAMAFASISTIEAGKQQLKACREDARAQGTNDIAVGLFQLEYTPSVRFGSGRDKRYCATTKFVNPFNLQFQAECAVSTVQDTVCKRWGSDFFDARGYWQELHGHDGKIAQIISNTIDAWGICN